MKKEKRGVLFQTQKQMNNGAIASGIGFAGYLVLMALEMEQIANFVAIAFGVVALWTLLSVAIGRRRDKEAVSYNLLWGQGALTVLMVACAVLSVQALLGI